MFLFQIHVQECATSSYHERIMRNWKIQIMRKNYETLKLKHSISMCCLSYFIHIGFFIFWHHLRRFNCCFRFKFMSRSVQLAHITKELRETEKSIGDGISALPKNGLNRTPKFLVKLAIFVKKRPATLAIEFLSRNQTFLKNTAFFSWYQARLSLIIIYNNLSQCFGFRNLSR